MRSRVKICGITRAEDARLAAALGADAIGLIFTPRSPRCLTLAQALAIRAALPPLVAIVALFMDAPAAEVIEVSAALRPDLLQFHGAEDDTCCTGFGRPWFKALAMREAGDVPARMAQYPHAAGFVLDGHAIGEPGGQGQGFDWAQLPPLTTPWFLAGGLTADNVARAVRFARPWGVDVSSGVESAVGIKDAHKLQQFFREIHRETAAQDRA
ncbi:phosphoribosylanthranilate isomerase [Metallibacterium sp.]|uniref:phosphoribosylanthranilate isomerase n=1 Tax=Metallibacterium sp. TaxID=2940281 RepID=UPI00263088C7|nr:phosphoribosylanthranilate isomerase [Metallibacterium sp.]